MKKLREVETYSIDEKTVGKLLKSVKMTRKTKSVNKGDVHTDEPSHMTRREHNSKIHHSSFCSPILSFSNQSIVT